MVISLFQELTASLTHSSCFRHHTYALQIPTWLSPGAAHVMSLVSPDYGGHPVLRFFVWYHDTLSTAEQLEFPGGMPRLPVCPEESMSGKLGANHLWGPRNSLQKRSRRP